MAQSLQLSVHIEEWEPQVPFRLTGHVWETFRTVVAEISDGSHVGRGEGLPVYYLNETAETLCRQVESVARVVEQGINRQNLLELMPAGGARNAVDCALWDLEAKRCGRTIWDLTGIRPSVLTTVFTIGLEADPQAMAAKAAAALAYPILKIKLDRDRPVERVEAIRSARPDATLTVDANQGWGFQQLVEIAPRLAALDVKLIEQPLPRGADDELVGYDSPIPLSADESCQHRGELEQASQRYQIINIKLDKAGGLTEALLLAQAVREKGLELLVSNMFGTSLSMAPACVVAQLCKYVEIDGHLLLKHDRFPRLGGEAAQVAIPDPRLWG